MRALAENGKMNKTPLASRGKGGMGEIAITVFFGLLTLLYVLPLYYVLLASFDADGSNVQKIAYFIPTKLDFSAYAYLLKTNVLIRSFFNSVFITIVGTLVNMLMSTCTAYALSKKWPGKRLILNLIIFTMFFNGGMIPYYLTVKNVGLVNHMAVMIIPAAINTYYLIIMLTYFKTVPASLEESARIDGANDIMILFRIILPTSLPTMAALTLFYAVDRWNDWFFAMLFISDVNKTPLQYLLRETLMAIQVLAQNSSSAASSIVTVPTITVQMAVVVIASVPILLVYPFLQKYFAAGIMIGSIKE
jgi:putative aldouronate transport system permease protein